MRARMALKYAGIEYELREIDLRNKPQSLLQLSPKGTVPVLSVDGVVLDQSLQIIDWALDGSDPDGWKSVDEPIAQAWVQKNDGPFKLLLDQYKYPNRFPGLNQADVLDAAIELMLKPMENTLESSKYLMGSKLSWVDVAIFPFIRQFAAVNLQVFEGLALSAIQQWLNQLVNSELFTSVMHKSLTRSDPVEK
jgi:glutathione S-transferase